MAERILSGKIKQLVYTTEELSQSPLSTTVIDNGVLVYEKTSSGQIKCKMGDGNNVWSGLEYIDVIESSFFSDNGYKNMVEYVNLTDIPYNYYCSQCIVYNNELHVLGSDYEDSSLKHYKWDGSTWSEVSTLPYEFDTRANQIVIYNNEINILGSYYSSNYTKHYKFDGTSWSEVSTLPYNFYNSSAVVYNNEIHILGSKDSSCSTKHYKWDGSTWSEVSTLPYEFYQGIALVYNNEINIFSTYNGNTLSHYKYNISDNTWTKVSTLPYDCSDGDGVIYNNEIHIFGGYDNEYGHIKYDGSNWIELTDVTIDITNTGGVILYNNNIHLLSDTEFIKLYDRHYSIKGYCKKNTIINIQNSFPISNNIEVIDNGYRVIQDGIVEIGVYDETSENINSIFDNIQNQIDSKTEINDNTTNNIYYTYSTKKINDLIQTNKLKGLIDNKYNLDVNYLSINSNNNNFIGSVWEKSVDSLPYYFFNGSGVLFNNEIHILGGQYSNTKHYKLNSNTSTWSEVSTLPYDFYSSSAVVYNNEIHILGSYISENRTKHYKWDGSTWEEVSILPYSFSSGNVIVYNNEIHILGSNVLTTTEENGKKHYKWDGSTWEEVSTLPVWINKAVSVIYDNNIHIIKGSSHYSFNSNDSTWTKVSSFPLYNFQGGSGVVFNNEIHILGDYNDCKKHYKWDGSSWTEVSTLPYNFYCGYAVVYENKIHIIGNTNSSSSIRHCYYNPECMNNGEIVSLNIGNNIPLPITNPINDTQSSTKTTYSSDKIDKLLNNKISSDTIISVSNGGTGYNTITDTTYTTARYRASSLNSSETTPTTNGVIAWTYE